MKLNNGEKKLLGLILEKCSSLLGDQGCNDLTEDMSQCLTTDEWNSLSKYFHEQNGDPEEYFEGQKLPDYCVLYALLKKIDLK